MDTGAIERVAEVGSNRLVVLAAEVRSAHGGVLDAARTAAERAIEAGKALLEAKELVRHGEWLPWLKEHCGLPERTAQLYMQIAKLDLGAEVVAAIGLKAAAQSFVYYDQNYNVWFGCDDEQKRQWLLFICFGVHFEHVEWCRQKSFITPDEWLGEAGARWRRQCQLRAIPEGFVRAWEAFRDGRRDQPLCEVEAEAQRVSEEPAARDDREMGARSATGALLTGRRRKTKAA
jgi:hypothetical protein